MPETFAIYEMISNNYCHKRRLLASACGAVGLDIARAILSFSSPKQHQVDLLFRRWELGSRAV